jgi:DHA1 family bicyclomycin/chloramphenicol resistance-like MFS transporter
MRETSSAERRACAACFPSPPVSGFACAFAASIGVLVAARLVQGLGACVGPILGRAIVRDHYSGVHLAQMLSYVMLVFAFAPMVAPLMGGALLELFGWPSIFLAFGVFGLLLMLVTWLGFAESLSAPDVEALKLRRLAAKARRFFANRQCVGYMLMNSFIFAGLFAFISGAPFVYIEVYEVPPGHFGFYFALSAMGIVLGALANARLVRRHPPRLVLRLGLAVIAASGAAMLLIALAGWGSPLRLTLAMMVYVVAQGLSLPNAIAAAMEPLPDMAGMGASFLGAVQMLGGSIAGYVVNALYDRTPLPMAATIAAMGLGALLCYRLAVPGASRAGAASNL